MKTALLSSLNFSPAGPTAVPSTPSVREWLRTLHRVNPTLSWTGWLNVGLAGLALVLLPLDQRIVTGALVWLKPLKFSLSIIAFAWTLGWLLADLPAVAQRSVVVGPAVDGAPGVDEHGTPHTGQAGQDGPGQLHAAGEQ